MNTGIWNKRLPMTRCPGCNRPIGNKVLWEVYVAPSGWRRDFPVCGDCFSRATQTDARRWEWVVIQWLSMNAVLRRWRRGVED